MTLARRRGLSSWKCLDRYSSPYRWKRRRSAISCSWTSMSVAIAFLPSQGASHLRASSWPSRATAARDRLQPPMPRRPETTNTWTESATSTATKTQVAFQAQREPWREAFQSYRQRQHPKAGHQYRNVLAFAHDLVGNGWIGLPDLGHWDARVLLRNGRTGTHEVQHHAA